MALTDNQKQKISHYMEENYTQQPHGMMYDNWSSETMPVSFGWFGLLFLLYMFLAVLFLATGIAAFIKYLFRGKKQRAKQKEKE